MKIASDSGSLKTVTVAVINYYVNVEVNVDHINVLKVRVELVN